MFLNPTGTFDFVGFKNLVHDCKLILPRSPKQPENNFSCHQWGRQRKIEVCPGMTDLIRNSKIALEGHRQVMHSPGYRWESFRPRPSAGLLPGFHPCARSRLRTRSPPLCLQVRVWVFKPLPTPSRERESTLVWRKSQGLV